MKKCVIHFFFIFFLKNEFNSYNNLNSVLLIISRQYFFQILFYFVEKLNDLIK